MPDRVRAFGDATLPADRAVRDLDRLVLIALDLPGGNEID